MGGGRIGGRLDLDRGSRRLRGQAEPPPVPRPGAAPGHRGLRERRSRDAHQPQLCAPVAAATGRGHELSPHHGLRRGRRRRPRLRIRSDHRAGGARGGCALAVRAGARREQQPRQPRHQHPFLRRGSRNGGTARRCVHTGRVGGRGAYDRQALPGARRYADGFAYRTAGDRRRPRSHGPGGAAPLPDGGRCGGRRGDDGARRGAGGAGRRSAGHDVAVFHDRGSARRDGIRRHPLHRCAAHGRDHRRVRGGRGGGGRAGGRVRCGVGAGRHRRGGGRRHRSSRVGAG